MAWSQAWLSGFSSCFKAITLFLIWILFLVEVDAQNRSDEVHSLIQFQQDNSFIWTLSAYWSNWEPTDGNVCAWTGVTCTNNFTVQVLDLSGWTSSSCRHFGVCILAANLSSLSNLGDLTELDLSSNLLVSIEMGNLSGLTRLDISSNRLTAFPGGIFDLPHLTGLNLSANQIQGPIPNSISTCRNLRSIAAQQNQLHGDVPNLSGLINLQFLLLAGNQLSGPFPKQLGDLVHLVVLDLSDNYFSGVIPALRHATNLVRLTLDNNSFTGFEDPWFVAANNTLRSLSVSSNQLQGEIPLGLTYLQMLIYLNMTCNRLSGRIPFGLLKIGYDNPFFSLMAIDFSQNQLTGGIPADIISPPQVPYQPASGPACPFLNFSHNLLNGSIPVNDTATYIACFEALDLSFNNLSGPFPTRLFRNDMSFIGQLWLQNNRLSGDIVDVFVGGPGFQNTQETYLQNNLLEGDLSRMINSTSLYSPSVIDLSNNNLRWSPSVPDPVTAMLVRLYNATAGIWPEFLAEFKVAGNNLSGIGVPNGCLSDVSSLHILDLSNSHLKGELMPATFNSSCMPALQLLNLSNNEMSGPVPEALFELPNLQSLDLSANNLSGSLPLVPLNSSFFKPEIFAGNGGLCGLPLTPCPQVYPQRGIKWWELLIIIGGSVAMAMGSCLAATWRWRMYQKQHQQDVDLIATLLERDSASLMPLRDIKKATDNFAGSSQIGEGGFGTVYVGKLNNGTMVAIKRSKREGSDKDKEQFLNEVRILSQVNHRNLVKLLGCCLENKVAVLVFEFVSNGTLEQHLRGKMTVDGLSWKQRLNIAMQTASALNYLHTSTAFPIYHRDVKSANILLTEELDAKVADFGISKLAPLRATHVSTAAVQGTLGYIDPEYFSSYQLTDKSDVFSFGVVLLELISAKPALDFSRSGEESSLVNLAGPYVESGDLQGFIDPALLETYTGQSAGRHGRDSILNVGRLAMECVEMRSKARPTMNEVLKKLQNWWVELTSTPEHVDPFLSLQEDHEDNQEDRGGATQPDNIILLSNSFPSESSIHGGEVQFSRFSNSLSFRPISTRPLEIENRLL